MFIYKCSPKSFEKGFKLSEIPFNNDSLRVVESIIDKNKDLVFVLHNNEPILFNEASKDFFGVDTLKEFTREFGGLENKFVPHEPYFYPSKTGEKQRWQEALLALDSSEQIVSMISAKIKAYAFSITIEMPVDGVEIIYFNDITTNLIKNIMTKSHTDLDSESGAYCKRYFEYISPRFLSAAEFNEKLISTCLIDIGNSDTSVVKNIATTVQAHTRDDDMLVRWSNTSFLIVLLITSKEHAHAFGDKILSTLKQTELHQTVRISMTFQSNKEHIQTMIKRCENRLKESAESFLIA